MPQCDDNHQPDTICRHCDRRFSASDESVIGEYAKHLIVDHHFGGTLSSEEIERICFGPL
jgi:hypothetical protein